MPDEATPLFRTGRSAAESDKDAPRHRREGHFDGADQWHDVAEDSRLLGSA
ncbi:MAG: hypothetical protein JWQ70_2364 [Aeromicrobium sp.]|jgi:hypothetical protein|nr:hypothetical protein [Aeromicrobium sp.]